MTTHKDPAWVYRGKSVQQVVEELGTFDDLDMQVLISIDYGDSSAPIGDMRNKDDQYFIFYYKEKTSAYDRHYPGITIRQLIKELQSKEIEGMEVRLALNSNEDHKPVSIIGKKDGFCIFKSCSGYYDEKKLSKG